MKQFCQPKNSLYLNFLKTCFEQHSPHPLISNFQESVAKCPFFNLRKLPMLLSTEFIFFISNKQLKLLILWNPLAAVSVLINCTSSPIFEVISDCFFATQRTAHGQLLKVVSRSDKWLNPCTKAFYWRFNSYCIMNYNVFSPIANVP